MPWNRELGWKASLRRKTSKTPLEVETKCSATSPDAEDRNKVAG